MTESMDEADSVINVQLLQAVLLTSGDSPTLALEAPMMAPIRLA